MNGSQSEAQLRGLGCVVSWSRLSRGPARHVKPVLATQWQSGKIVVPPSNNCCYTWFILRMTSNICTCLRRITFVSLYEIEIVNELAEMAFNHRDRELSQSNKSECEVFKINPSVASYFIIPLKSMLWIFSHVTYNNANALCFYIRFCSRCALIKLVLVDKYYILAVSPKTVVLVNKDKLYLPTSTSTLDNKDTSTHYKS